MKISILILTKNEEINIAKCVESVRWSDDIVVLDSLSTDSTVEIARSLGCRIVERKFDNWAAHQNWALRNIEFKNEWVFNIDADELVDADFAREMQAKTENPGEFVAYRMRRKDHFRETWLKHATFYPTWFTRLYRPEKVRFERLVNPVTVVDGVTGALDGHLLHWPFSKGMSHWLERHNSYSTFESLEYAKRPPFRTEELFSKDAIVRRRAVKAAFSRMPFKPVLKFLYLYVAHRGFLDGRAGLDYAMLTSFYEYMISLKVGEMRDAEKTKQAQAHQMEKARIPVTAGPEN